MPHRHRRRPPANAHISARVLLGARILFGVIILGWSYAIGALAWVGLAP